jgi:formylglycine-generating enzyme required for sulfatase activity
MKRTMLWSALIVGAISFLAFSSAKKLIKPPKEIRKEFAYIPQGAIKQENDERLIPTFFMQKTEVSNGEYLEFINDLIITGQNEMLAVALPDTSAWRRDYAFNEPFVIHYFRHPAYRNYPVVNVSYEGAKAYCDWRTKKALANRTKDGYTAVYRLPSKEEWIYAAMNTAKNSTYSWGGSEIFNAKGCALCNHAQTVSIIDSSSDNADITAIVDAYAPSAWGIYNQNGNVAEMVYEKGIAMGGSWRSTKEEVCNTCESQYNKAMPTVGFRTVVTYIKAQ